MENAHKTPNPWLYYLVAPLLLVFLAAAVYYPSLHYEFQFDDIANITKHFDIRHNTFQDLKFSGSRWISYWLNAIHYSIGKFDPFSYRVGNVIIHIANGLLIFFLLFLSLAWRRREKCFFKTNAFFISFITSLLFLLHPVQTQTVSYVIQGELEGLAALSILSMALCLLFLSRAKETSSKIIYGIMLFGLAALSCGTKEISLISPALLIIFDWFFIAQGSWQDIKKRLWIYAALSAVIITIYIKLLKVAFFKTLLANKKNNIGNVITQDPAATITPYSFLISQFKVIVHYIWIFLWPFNISVEYDWVLSKSFFSADCLIPLMGLLAIARGIIRMLLINSSNLIAFGAVWFFACLAPRTSIIPSPELLVDYKTYMASIGWLFILSCGIVFAAKKLIEYYKNIPLLSHHYYGSLAFGLILALPLGIATTYRNTVWRSGLEFWGNVIKNAPGKARAYNNYGVDLSTVNKQFKEAIPYFQKAISMDKNYADPCNNLAVAYAQIGQLDNAIVALQQSIKINPYYPECHNNLASFLIQKRELDKAEQALQLALKIRPHYGKAHFNLGRIHLDRGDNEKAWESFKTCCTKADLDTDIGFGTYAKVSLGLKKYDDAIYAYKKTLEMNPKYPEARFNLANAYFFAGDYQNAVNVYQHVLKETPAETRAWYNQGEAYIKLNMPQKALDCFAMLDPKREDLYQLPIRKAACYEKLGNKSMALDQLSIVANNIKAPDAIRSMVKNLIVSVQNNKNGNIGSLLAAM